MCSMKLSVGEYIKFLHETYIPSVDKAQIFKVVCGNQSADLDSVVSAISYSYFSYRVNTQDVLIPIINIPRNQLKIRKDILYLLNQVSISPDSLFFIEELQNFAEKFGKVKAVLVDHNDPQGGARNIVDVVGIIDHHVDLGLHKDLDNGSGPRIIETTGSCSSLVLQYWRKSLQEDELCAMKEPLRMCWSALALDTSLMHNKVKEADIEANKIYSKCLSGLNFEQEYQTLLTARNDLSGLTGLQVLEKDFKDFSSLTTRREEIRVGSSSVPGKSLGWFKEQNIDIVGACYELNSQLQLDYEVVLSHWREADVPRRQLLFVTKEENLDQLWDIVNFIKDELRLVEDCPFSNYPGVLAFEQLNVNASRKQVIPLLQSAISKL